MEVNIVRGCGWSTWMIVTLVGAVLRVRRERVSEGRGSESGASK